MSPAKITDISRIKYELERFFLGGAFVLCEEERRLAEVQAECCVAEISYGKLVLSCWGEVWSRAWRVLAYEMRGKNLRLHCTRQMGRAPCFLTLQRGQAQEEAEKSRAEFAEAISGWIAANRPGVHVEQLIQARDDYRHLSGIHTRLILKERGHTVAAVAVNKSESQDHIDATLGAGLMWLEELRGRGRKVKRLAVFVPAGRALTIACRLTRIEMEGLPISLYEVDEAQKLIKPVAAFAQADLSDKLKRAARHALWPARAALSTEAASLLEELQTLSRDAMDTQQRSGWLDLSVRGLTFARLSLRRAVVEFGVNRPRKKLTPVNRTELADLLAQINRQRRADRGNRGDELFRLHSERWLESIIRKDVSRLDPALDVRFVYSQVPAYRGEQRSFIDLLTITRSGRLVVMELKVCEDAEFVFQGLDYWMRIDWHRRRNDFERRGYFRGLQLADEPPLLYLVAPLFRFHATTKLLAGRVSSQVPIYRISINDDWRSELRVLLQERLN
jgi:hypothetical protein